jgi:hypothetical protein
MVQLQLWILKLQVKKRWKTCKFGKILVILTAKYESSTYFRAQQSIYGYQFYNSTGITPDLKLMPFDMKLGKDKIGYIEDIDLAPLVEDSQDTIDLEYLPEIENYGITKTTPEIKAPIKKRPLKKLLQKLI